MKRPRSDSRRSTPLLDLELHISVSTITSTNSNFDINKHRLGETLYICYGQRVQCPILMFNMENYINCPANYNKKLPNGLLFILLSMYVY